MVKKKWLPFDLSKVSKSTRRKAAHRVRSLGFGKMKKGSSKRKQARYAYQMSLGDLVREEKRKK